MSGSLGLWCTLLPGLDVADALVLLLRVGVDMQGPCNAGTRQEELVTAVLVLVEVCCCANIKGCIRVYQPV